MLVLPSLANKQTSLNRKKNGQKKRILRRETLGSFFQASYQAEGAIDGWFQGDKRSNDKLRRRLQTIEAQFDQKCTYVQDLKSIKFEILVEYRK